jgi:hypothetical protein
MCATEKIVPKEVFDTLSQDEKKAVQRKARIERRKKVVKLARRFEPAIHQVEYALRECRGILTAAANLLGTKRDVLQRVIDRNPHLTRVLDSIVEENLDKAEWMLLEQVDQGNMSAISLLLKTKGKERGYTERNTLEHEIGDKTRNSAALIEAMRKGIGTQVETEDTIIEGDNYTWVESQPAEQNHDQTS